MLDIVKVLQADRVVAVMRKMDDKTFPFVVNAVIQGGIRTIEITMDGSAAAAQIAHVKQRFEGQAFVGAGTVLTIDGLRQAVSAGAEFLVCPHLNVHLLEEAKKLGCPMVPGVFSPTEIAAALQAGAEVVKIFPAGTLGPGYIRNILGPFHGLRVMATGSVSESNMEEFFEAGAMAVGLGSNLFPKQDVETKNWDAIRERSHRIRTLVP